MQSISDNAIGKTIPEDRCNPVKAEKINYPTICREVEKRVQKDAHRGHRLPLTKSSFAVNRVSKVYRSEVHEILKKCSKLDRMLIQRNNPEAETESDSTVSIEEIMSGLKSAQKESNVSEESASEDTPLVQISGNKLLSWGRGNTEENKSSHKTLQPNIEYSEGDNYEGPPSMEVSFETSHSIENSINETTSRRDRSRLRGYKKDNRSYLKDITTDNILQSEVLSNNFNSQLKNSNIENSHVEISKEEKRTKSVESSPNYSTPETSSLGSSSKIDLSKLNDATIDDEEFYNKPNPGNNIDAAGSEMITSTRRNASKQKTKNSNESTSTTKGIAETPSKVTKRSKLKIGSRKRTRTSSRTIGTQTKEDPQPSSSRQRIQEPLLPSLPFGQLIAFDKNGTPCKLVMMSINPNYFK